MIYDIWYLFTAIGFPPGGSGRWTCKNVGNGQLYRQKGETIHKTIYKTPNKHNIKHTQNKKTNINIILKSIIRVI